MQTDNKKSFAMEILHDYKKDNQILKALLLVSVLVNIVIVLLLKQVYQMIDLEYKKEDIQAVIDMIDAKIQPLIDAINRELDKIDFNVSLDI